MVGPGPAGGVQAEVGNSRPAAPPRRVVRPGHRPGWQVHDPAHQMAWVARPGGRAEVAGEPVEKGGPGLFPPGEREGRTQKSVAASRMWAPDPAVGTGLLARPPRPGRDTPPGQWQKEGGPARSGTGARAWPPAGSRPEPHDARGAPSLAGFLPLAPSFSLSFSARTCSVDVYRTLPASCPQAGTVMGHRAAGKEPLYSPGRAPPG